MTVRRKIKFVNAKDEQDQKAKASVRKTYILEILDIVIRYGFFTTYLLTYYRTIERSMDEEIEKQQLSKFRHMMSITEKLGNGNQRCQRRS